MTDTTSKRFGSRHVIALLALGLLALAAAHAHLDVSMPEDRSVVTEPLGELTLTFTEPVEMAFSHFELVPLQAETTRDGYGAGGSAWDTLDEAAKALHDQLVAAGPAATGADEAEDGENAPVTLELVSEGAVAEVVLQVSGELEPGDYMLFFNVLSVDTHTSSGYLIFSYQPQI